MVCHGKQGGEHEADWLMRLISSVGCDQNCFLFHFNLFGRAFQAGGQICPTMREASLACIVSGAVGISIMKDHQDITFTDDQVKLIETFIADFENSFD